MFKFMKSKKGFSLVELMIVVVIMAILVAVAVPIFNSVTGNSRAKTCIDNQRSIISTLNTALLSETVDEEQSFTIAYDGKKATYNVTNLEVFTEAELKGLFQTPPYCPVDNSLITVTLTPTTDGMATISTVCRDNNDSSAKNPHILNAAS